jgi:hypothetical protein
MDNHDQIDIERELRTAMVERSAVLPRPRIDLRAIRRRTATRRRVLVPVIATSLALLTAAPFAVAQGGLLRARSTGSTVGEAVTPPQSPTGSTGAGATGVAPSGPGIGPSGSHDTQPGSQGGGLGSKGAGVVNGGCVNLHAPLTAAERAALSNDAEAVLARGQADLGDALDKGGLGGSKAVAFSDDLANRLLPKVGAIVDQVECAGQRHLAAAQRQVTLDQVRAAVLSTGLVTGVIMDRTSGWLGLSAGDMSASLGVAGVARDSLVMTGTLKSGGLLRFEHTMTVTMALPDCGVTKVDLGDLGLPGMGLDDLRPRLSSLSGGMRGVVPGILAANATIVSLPTP